MIPAWAPIDFKFDAQPIEQELLSNNIFSKGELSTVIYGDQGHSMWDKKSTFSNLPQFSKFENTPRYTLNEFGEKILVSGSIGTFNTVNLTYIDAAPTSLTSGWDGELAQGNRTPLWIKHQAPWKWRSDLNLDLTKALVAKLPFEFLLTVRCIYQQAPSIGIAHIDSSKQMNEKFYADGFGSISLNIASGGAKLHYIDSRTQEINSVDENKYMCWHFDDSNLHCTTEVLSHRIQIRVFGKLKKSYSEILKFS